MEDELKILERENKYFDNHIEDIVKRFGEDTFVAISGEQVVDHDANMFDLTMRFTKNYGNKPALITSVRDYIACFH